MKQSAEEANNRMLRLRKKLAQYQELFYLVFILSVAALFSAGLNSTDRIYQIIFGISALFLLLKVAVTDYTLREFIWMAIIALLLGLTLLRNGEKTLIITVMGIFGAKNISLEKVFRNSLWLKVALTVGTIALASIGVIENEALLLPKNGELYTLYCYGYNHPNAAFANILMLFMAAVLIWQDKLKWYAYAGFSLVLMGAYYLFMCRTGLVVWAGFVIMVLEYVISHKWGRKKICLCLLLLVPIVLALLTFLLPLISMHDSDILTKVDFYLTGRIRLLIQGIQYLGIPLIGNIPRIPFDNAYFHLVYNYGWITAIICFLAYVYTMWDCIKRDRPYEVIVLSTMSVYGFMEHWPLSVGWNISLLCLSRTLFRDRS